MVIKSYRTAEMCEKKTTTQTPCPSFPTSANKKPKPYTEHATIFLFQIASIGNTMNCIALLSPSLGTKQREYVSLPLSLIELLPSKASM
jgi:hypothetical protein